MDALVKEQKEKMQSSPSWPDDKDAVEHGLWNTDPAAHVKGKIDAMTQSVLDGQKVDFQ